MLYAFNWTSFSVFAVFVAGVLWLSFYLGRRARSSRGYYAAHGQIHWFVNGIAFAGDYLSAASFLGICGLVAFYGYDGFLYSIGYLAGWIVALFVIAEPIKRMGRFTFADALDARFKSRGIQLSVAISTLVVSVFYLIPQMVGAGSLIVPLLGLKYWHGVVIVGVTVTFIVVTAGMVSTTWVQFIKGSLLVIFCILLVGLILARGLKQQPGAPVPDVAQGTRLAHEGGWKGQPYERYAMVDGSVRAFRYVVGGDGMKPTGQLPADVQPLFAPDARGKLTLVPAQMLTVRDGQRFVNGLPQTRENDIHPVGSIAELPGDEKQTGPLGPFAFISTMQDSKVRVTAKQVIKEPDGGVAEVYAPVIKSGSDLLTPGASPTFAGVRSPDLVKKLDFISLMLALFCGTASLPHILIRYYTVKDQASARKSTVAGIASIGCFYVLTLYLGLGAMTSGEMDPTNSNMAAPLLAHSFNHVLFAIVSAIAFTTVLGTVSGLIMAGSGAVAHDLMANVLKIHMDDRQKVLAGKVSAAVIGGVAMVLGIYFEKLNASFLVGWAFNIAASANLPALVMLLFWKGTTRQGIIASVTVGMLSSLGWILASAQCYRDVYGLDPKTSIVPFSQPGLVTIPLGFAVLVGVSLLTRKNMGASTAANAL